MLSLDFHTISGNGASPDMVEEGGTRAMLDARSVEAGVLHHVGAVETVDFRNRPWSPGQANSRAIADQVVFETLVGSVKRVTDSVMLQMLRSADRAW